MALISYLEHLLIQLCDGMAGHHIGAALLVGLPCNGGLRLDLLRHCVVTNRGSNGQVQLHIRPSAALCIGKGHIDQRLANLPIRRLRVATAIRVSIVVVVLCVLHVLVLITKPIRVIGAHYLQPVVQVSFRHIQPVINTSRAVGLGQRQGKEGVWFCTGERGLGKQAG